MALSIIGISFLNNDEKNVTEISETATPSSGTLSEEKKSDYVKTHKYSKPASKFKNIESEEKQYEPSPDELNLAFYYPDDADTSDSINSYAGQIFTELLKMNTDYYASYYDLSDSSPSDIANQLGLSDDRVAGQYDPRNENHDIKNSETWKLDSFKNINIVFKDSNGNKISGRYVVNEIMSMANVYSYYHDMNDADAMLDYCKELFSNSLSANISMGNVYYCSGCLHRSLYDEAIEAMAMDTGGIITEENPESSDYLENLKEQSRLQKIKYKMEEMSSESKNEDNIYDDIDLNEDDNISLTGADKEESGSISQDAYRLNLENDSNSEGLYYGDTDSSQDAASDSDNDTEPETTKYTQISKLRFEELNSKRYKSERKYGNSSLESDEEETETVSYSVEDLQESVAVKEGIADEPTTEIGPNYDKYDDFVSEKSLLEGLDEEDNDSVLYSDKVLETKGDYLSDDNEDKSSDSEINDENTGDTEKNVSILTDEDRAIIELLKQIPGVNSYSSYCPGHIDLYVTITIKGIDDGSLFKADTIGNDKNNFNEDWQGWTEEKIAYARKLKEKNWFDTYGLTISAINIMQPLDEKDINNYLKMLPANISADRKAIIEYALNSVGKVPYYWGGKPVRGGYETNEFNKVTDPDTYGRILKGLDCSGWVNWVYWSVLGSSLEGEGTGTLAACGKKIKRSELQPGDIIIRTGADAHVVMFLAWASDGNMIVIHETGGIINNVTVSCITANWPYYRSLINDDSEIN